MRVSAPFQREARALLSVMCLVSATLIRSIPIILLVAGPFAAFSQQPVPSEPKVFEVVARRFSFEPSTIEVTEGDTVRLAGALGRRSARRRNQSVQGQEGRPARQAGRFAGDDRVRRDGRRRVPNPVLRVLRQGARGHDRGARRSREAQRRSMKRLLLFTIMTAAGLVCASCDEKLERASPGRRRISSRLFSSIQANIFNVTRFERSAGLHPVSYRSGPPCRPEGWCCSRAARTSSWSESPASTRPGATRVIPGDPDNSYLVQKTRGRGISVESACRVEPDRS